MLASCMVFGRKGGSDDPDDDGGCLQEEVDKWSLSSAYSVQRYTFE